MKKIKKNYTIALIPAKKISRGLKNKNMRKINGKSLSEIAIMNAKKSKYIDKIYVSTDSKKISLLAKKYALKKYFDSIKKESNRSDDYMNPDYFNKF